MKGNIMFDSVQRGRGSPNLSVPCPSITSALRPGRYYYAQKNNFTAPFTAASVVQSPVSRNSSLTSMRNQTNLPLAFRYPILFKLYNKHARDMFLTLTFGKRKEIQ